MISWGSNLEWFNYLMFDYFPMFNKFRSVSMAITLAILGFSIMGAVGLTTLLETENLDQQKKLILKSFAYYAGTVIVIWLGLVMFGDFSGLVDDKLASAGYPDWLLDAYVNQRKAFLQSSALRVLTISGIVFGLLYFLNRQLSKSNLDILSPKLSWLYVAIAVVSSIELYNFNRMYLNEEDFEQKRKATAIIPDRADQQIMSDKSEFRVLDMNNPFNNGITSNFHNSIGGYHGAKMRRYQDLIDLHISQNNQKVLDMLNTKYIIANTENGRQPIPRNSALGNVWFVEKVHKVKSPDEEISFLGDKNFNPAKTAVIDESKFPLDNKTYLSRGKIKMVSYEPNHLVYESITPSNQLAIFSEIYYSAGWKAFIDNEEVDILRANYILRALQIPSGSHKIEFKFEPDSYYKGETYSLIFSIIMLIVIFGSIGYSIFDIYKKGKSVQLV